MLNKYVLILSFIFISFSFANNHDINIVVDKNSKEYIVSIEKELSSLFSNSDKLKYKIKICQNDCSKYLKKRNTFVLLKENKKYKKVFKNFILTYNQISSLYDKNKVVRISALGIYEMIKEKKYDSLYVDNKQKKIPKLLEDTKDLKVLDLKDIFALAAKNNLSIKQNHNNKKINNINIDEAKSYYKPQIDIYSNITIIDGDRAEYSSGLYSEGSLQVGVKVSQLVYSNKILENIKIKKLLAKSSTDEIKSLNDEIMYKATLLYLNIIKAKKTNQIIKINHDFISQNLDFARQRVSIGVKDRSDVLRWESELANINIKLANSKKELNSLKIELSNLLQINSEFDVFEYSLNSKLFKLDNKDAIGFIKDKRVQNSFSNNIVHSHSKLKQITFLKDIKQKELNMNKDSRYLPTVVLEGSADRILDRYGKGEDTIRYWDDNEYSAVLNINIPIYEGGLKRTNIQKNQIELINLKLQYKQMKNLIIENVRKNFESLKRSYEKIKFAKISQEASQKNFELIQDKYKNGKENIISLLDAQDSYIIAQLNLNISTIEYLSDLSSIYFFSGKIDILINEDKKKEVERNILNTIKGFKK